MEKCERCKKVVKKDKGYPIMNRKIYCKHCFDLLRWKEKIKREEEKRCQKNLPQS